MKHWHNEGHSLDELEALEQPHDLEDAQNLDDAQHAFVPNRIHVCAPNTFLKPNFQCQVAGYLHRSTVYRTRSMDKSSYTACNALNARRAQ
jgi:hypothetical protein